MQFLVFSIILLIVATTGNGQTIYVLDDTLKLEIGSGYDLGPNGKNGVWEYPFDNNPQHAVKFRATFRDDILHGPFHGFWENGNKRVVLTFLNGLKTGQAQYFTQDGKLQFEMNYFDDFLQGEFTSFYKSGRKMQIATFHRGLLSGSSIAYENDKRTNSFC